MLHGKKRQAKQELSEEQKKEIEVKLKKILTINQTLLKKRANKDFDRASLEQTEKFSSLSPDFQTLWNYRREIIEHIFNTEYKEMTPENLKAKYEFVFKELEFLVKSIMRSPKSYTLWFHRQWIIQKGLEVEQTQVAQQIQQSLEKKDDEENKEPQMQLQEERRAELLKQLSVSKVLEFELKLCDKMLGMDERNFHCWNYRLLISLQYLQEKESRLSQFDEEARLKIKNQFLEKECQMAETLIKKNFSNFSAWHYRSKLMPIMYKTVNTDYLIPFDKIQDDLALLKHAFFTDPKDQSPWNYHEWLISLISPVQIASLTLEKSENGHDLIVLGLSQKVKNFNSLNISLLNDVGKQVDQYPNVVAKPHNTQRDISSVWSIELPENIPSYFSLQIHQTEESSLKHIEDTRLLFRDFFVHINLENKKFELPSSEIWIRDNSLIDNLTKILNADIENIKELTDFEKGLRFAVQRLKDLVMLKHEFLANPFYLTDGSQLDSINNIESYLEELTSNLIKIDLQSHQALHNKTLKSWSYVKFKWEKVYESGSLEWPILKDRSEIADRHLGYFSC
ncbi:geranylgeranyl transferase type-2 subunit alpha [Stylonychia lemnae]|uniref:Geranylgeranyl transferase type-2 subunit alpha n=1 Tax=Stylonychia lemnae TaxID=5949 RepID=A0A078AL16_STYLE|nr:geranylgeranyl transferase type-2 subunit alpha [Stylonychia lemnae]|eukprot:CDW83060.1 geranylgeranyl transferase type-2 subunit alpha [Stylonychia lemnae]